MLSQDEDQIIVLKHTDTLYFDISGMITNWSGVPMNMEVTLSCSGFE